VDVVNGTGSAASAQQAAADLVAAGLTVGTSIANPAATSSAIEYAAAQETAARALATDAQSAALLKPATVAHVTVVLGGPGATTLLSGLAKLAATC
jgi:hypothetical protein